MVVRLKTTLLFLLDPKNFIIIPMATNLIILCVMLMQKATRLAFLVLTPNLMITLHVGWN